MRFSPILKEASRVYGSGESEDHKALKEYVARNPHVIGLGSNISVGVTEYRLPSGDTVDVSFSSKAVWIAAEIKSAISAESDIVRGYSNALNIELLWMQCCLLKCTLKSREPSLYWEPNSLNHLYH